VDKLLEIAFDEFEKEFYNALVASAAKSKKSKSKTFAIDTEKIIAKAKARAGKK
jgi:hypothetical protein